MGFVIRKPGSHGGRNLQAEGSRILFLKNSRD